MSATSGNRRRAKTSEPTIKNVVYIGPNRLLNGLKRYTVYREMPSELVATASAKYKNVARLFVPIDNLGQAMKYASTKGTPINLAYRELERGE